MVGLLRDHTDAGKFFGTNAGPRLMLEMRSRRCSSGRGVDIGRDSELAKMCLNGWASVLLLLCLGVRVSMLALSLILVECSSWNALERIQQGHGLTIQGCASASRRG